ncbi:MAG: PIN domain-containing protein [Euryarchaeota archaeon]|nr:PIN domain-containing protein [Euryarchaeota archaeon]
MTANPGDVFFDTWAWWEIIANTARGRRLQARYVARGDVRVHTSVLTLAEIAAKFGEADVRGPKALALIEARARVHPVGRDLAIAGGFLRSQLRVGNQHAGIVDAMILASARHAGAVLISGDPAFDRQADVRDH